MILQYKPTFNRPELAKEVSDYILGDGWFTEHRRTEEFEKKIAEFLGVKYCSVVNNGTISLSLALLAMGVQAGDYVIVPNITMIATCNAVKLIGAKCVFIDLDEKNLCLDLGLAMKSIEVMGGRVKAVIYVTLNGRSHPVVEYEEFRKYCEVNSVSLLEDNAQSFGSQWSDKTKISCPKNGIGSFSFSMPKIITTGQGGCLVTNDKELADKIKKLKDFGRSIGGIDVHDSFGINSKFTEIQAIIGLSQMRDIELRMVKKSFIYEFYRQKLKDVTDVTFVDHKSLVWFVDIFVPNRKELQDFLYRNEIHTRAIYPELTSQLCNSGCAVKTMDVSGKYAQSGLWLPSYTELEEEDITLICNKITEFYRHN